MNILKPEQAIGPICGLKTERTKFLLSESPGHLIHTLFRIRESLCSNLGLGTGFVTEVFLRFLHVSRKILGE